MRLALLLSALLLCSGCYSTNGTKHYIVIGLGIVSVNDTNQAYAQVIHSKMIGVYGSGTPGIGVGAGYRSSSVIEVFKSPVDITVSNNMAGDLKVENK